MFNILFSKNCLLKLCCYPGTGQKGIGPDSILVMSPKGDYNVMMMTLLYLTKPSLLFIPLPIHFWPWEIYQLLGEPLKPGGPEGQDPARGHHGNISVGSSLVGLASVAVAKENLSDWTF